MVESKTDSTIGYASAEQLNSEERVTLLLAPGSRITFHHPCASSASSFDISDSAHETSRKLTQQNREYALIFLVASSVSSGGSQALGRIWGHHKGRSRSTHAERRGRTAPFGSTELLP